MYYVAYACTDCRRSFKRPGGVGAPFERVCPACQGTAINLGRHFKPPRRADDEQWAKVCYLVKHGFFFQHVYESARGGAIIRYPRTLAEARSFVKKYARQGGARLLLVKRLREQKEASDGRRRRAPHSPRRT